MSDMNIDLTTIADFKEKLIPEGNYQVVVKKATVGVTSVTERPKIDLQLKIVDNIPAGEDLSGYEDDFEYPLEKLVFGSIMFPLTSDKPQSSSFMMKMLRDWVLHFGITPSDPNDLKAFAKEFIGTEGGIIVAYEPSDRNDPDSDPKANVKRSCALGI